MKPQITEPGPAKRDRSASIKEASWKLIALNCIALAVVLWHMPTMVLTYIAWIVVESLAMRRLPCWKYLRNVIAAAGHLLVGLGAAGILAWLTGRALYYCGGPFVNWSADVLVAEHPWVLAPISLVPFFMGDLASYFAHRVVHKIPCFWRLHAVHHSDTIFDVTTNLRSSWFEPTIQAAITAVFLKLINIQTPQIMAVVLITSQWAIFVHFAPRISFGWLTPFIGGPQYHRIHHSREPRHFNKNFSIAFPIIDIIGRTYYRPAPDEWPETGVEGTNEAGPVELLIGHSVK